MPMYMDIHDAPGATAQALEVAHLADVKTQDKYGVTYHKYWLNEAAGKVFCLCTAPSAEAAMQVHREAHGLLAQKIIEIDPDVADGFLGDCDVNPAGAAMIPGTATAERDPGIRTVVFTDIVDSTTLTQVLGDDESLKLLQVHDSIVREALRACCGHEIKHTGDGIMASFVSAVSAVRCAMQIHRALGEHADDDPASPVLVRIGAAAGEPVEANRDLFGTTVQLAARLCHRAEPQQSLVSNVVAELCIGKGLAFTDLGEVTLKGFEVPVHVHAVQ